MTGNIHPDQIQHLQLFDRGNQPLPLCKRTHKPILREAIADQVDALVNSPLFQEHLKDIYPHDSNGAYFNVHLTNREITVQLIDRSGRRLGRNSIHIELNPSKRKAEGTEEVRGISQEILDTANDIYQECLQDCPQVRGRRYSSDSLSHRDVSPIHIPTRKREDKRSRSLSSPESSPNGASSRKKEKRSSSLSSSLPSSGSSPISAPPRKKEVSSSLSHSLLRSPIQDHSESPESPEVRGLRFTLHNKQEELSTLRSSPKPNRKETAALQKEIKQLRNEIRELKQFMANPPLPQFRNADFRPFPPMGDSTHFADSHFANSPQATSRQTEPNGNTEQVLGTREQQLDPQLANRSPLPTSFMDIPLNEYTHEENMRIEAAKTKWEEKKLAWENLRETRRETLKAKIENETTKKKESEELEKKKAEDERRDARRLKDRELQQKREDWEASLKKREANSGERIEAKDEKRKAAVAEARRNGNLKFFAATEQRDEKVKAQDARAQQNLTTVKTQWGALPEVTKGHRKGKAQ